jgi:hypothetical protein
VHRRKVVVQFGSAVAALFTLGACATVGTLLPSSVSQSRESLEQLVKTKAIGTWRYNDLLSLRVKEVHLALLPRTQRFALRFEVEILESVFDKRWPGVIAMEAAVRFDPTKNQLVLVDPNVVQLDIAGLPKSVAGVAKALATHTLDQRLNGVAVYQLSESVARALASFSLRPGTVKVEEHQVSLELIAQK